ncbi:MAG: mechanosensitive ion channel family protein [Phycisphaerae bacterium]|nr:mechanosensitive ion channel family protein [Phycisphaerae bacterium]
MGKFVEKLQSYSAIENWAVFLAHAIAVILLLLLALLANYIAKRFILKIIKKVVSKTSNKWDDLLLKRKVLDKLSHLAPALVIYYLVPEVFSQYGDVSATIEVISKIYMIMVGLLVVDSLLNCAVDIYRTFTFSRSLPIRGFVQVVKIVLYFAVGISILSMALGKNPSYFLGGMGAMTAILLLVFKDSILNFVAGIQLSSNQMVRIGDWVEMSAFGADGDVIDISLTAVKIQNWDKTISTIPPYAMVTNSFKNWRGMSESGGRRIKRSLCIDVTSIKFCDEEILGKFRKIHYLSEYIDGKLSDIARYNKENGIDESLIVNGRHLTNVGTFRAYVEAYLKNNPKIHKDMTFLVRQLPATEKGLPIEIYVFCNDQVWANYEAIQADIFDHFFAILPEFGLRVYQLPTGNDLQMLGVK